MSYTNYNILMVQRKLLSNLYFSKTVLSVSMIQNKMSRW